MKVAVKTPNVESLWVNETLFARLIGSSVQSLRNQRYRDLKDGRKEAKEGYPRYRRFGKSVRYWRADAQIGETPSGEAA